MRSSDVMGNIGEISCQKDVNGRLAACQNPGVDTNIDATRLEARATKDVTWSLAVAAVEIRTMVNLGRAFFSPDPLVNTVP
jgi:hypothetical protein